MAPIALIASAPTFNNNEISSRLRPKHENVFKHMIHSARAPNEDNSTEYLGVGIGLGIAMLVVASVVVYCLLKARSKHKRAMARMDESEQQTNEMEEREAAALRAERQKFGYSFGRRPRRARSQCKQGWGALGSSEDMRSQYSSASPTHVSLAKRMMPNGIPLTGLRHLSTIIESPRTSPAIVATAASSRPRAQTPQPDADLSNSVGRSARRHADDVFIHRASTSPDDSALPRYTVQIPKKSASNRASMPSLGDDRMVRSRSLGSLLLRNSSTQKTLPSSQSTNFSRPRSLSLCSNTASRPPSCAAPPLPIIAPHSISANSLMAVSERPPSVCSSLTSSRSSRDSTGTSVLRVSPIVKFQEQYKEPMGSPSVEEMVAADDRAELKEVPTRQWTDQQLGLLDFSSSRHGHGSAYGTTVDADGSTSGEDEKTGTPSKSHGSSNKTGIARRPSTPRKPARGTSVSECGSPAERKHRHSQILRDVSANARAPSRHASETTLVSSASSNGNPFQWDMQPLSKPSALKGSPNARQGHKRQNCVRISTLTPQILGPPNEENGTVTPTIEEEAGDGGYFPKIVAISAAQRRISASVPNLRLEPPKASSTASSPTLSTWMAYEEHHGLLPRPTGETRSASPASASKRQSQSSSLFQIPAFPSPGRSTVSPIQQCLTTPEFCLPGSSPPETATCPFTCPSPLSTNTEVHHSERDPQWPVLTIPAAQQTGEYDPASPDYACVDVDPQRSSPIYPPPKEHDAAVGHSNLISDKSDSPPCSPKSIPQDFEPSRRFAKGLASPQESSAMNVTSANASALMAQLEENSNFPGAPVLRPPESDFTFTSPGVNVSYPTTLSTRQVETVSQRSTASGNSGEPASPTGQMAQGTTTTPQGPRVEPAKSVLKNAMALRRMNSEVDRSGDSESRRYVRLGREPSIMLPCLIGSPDPNDGCGEFFDFAQACHDWQTNAGAQESSFNAGDIEDMERQLQAALNSGGVSDEQKENTPPDGHAESDEQAELSVWADGEKYWQGEPPPEATKQSPRGPREATPKSVKSSRSPSRSPHAARTPKKTSDRDSIQRTPQSLYDASGFLKM